MIFFSFNVSKLEVASSKIRIPESLSKDLQLFLLNLAIDNLYL